MRNVKDLPIDLIDYIHSYIPYKQDFNKVLKELIIFDVHDEWEGECDIPFYGMDWKGPYTNGSIWVRGTCMKFTNSSHRIQITNLVSIINYINGETTYPYANGMFGEPEYDRIIWFYDDVSFLIGDFNVRDELIRVDKIAKRNHVTQCWI